MSGKIITQFGAVLLMVLFALTSGTARASEHEEASEDAPKAEEKAGGHEAESAKPTKKKAEAEHGGGGEHGAGAEHGGGGEHGGAAVERIGAIYVQFKPAFIVNYGGPGRLKYIKTDLSVRVQDSKTATAVQHHMPYLRNNLVMLFSSQTEESVSSQEGKEALRKAALEKVRELIHNEEKLDGIIDLYFTAFLVQH